MDSDEVDEIERQQTKNEWNWIWWIGLQNHPSISKDKERKREWFWVKSLDMIEYYQISLNEKTICFEIPVNILTYKLISNEIKSFLAEWISVVNCSFYSDQN
jgi:hypothetical protein